MRNRQKGFSLIELLIVVFVILIIAAIAIPNLLRARSAANESSAVASLRAINTSEIIYASTYDGFSTNLASMGSGGASCTTTTIPTSTAACLIDDVLAADPATKSGYTFTYAAVGAGGGGVAPSYSVSASPVAPGSTGLNGFFTDQSGVITVDPSGTATSTSSPL